MSPNTVSVSEFKIILAHAKGNIQVYFLILYNANFIHQLLGTRATIHTYILQSHPQ